MHYTLILPPTLGKCSLGTTSIISKEPLLILLLTGSGFGESSTGISTTLSSGVSDDSD